MLLVRGLQIHLGRCCLNCDGGLMMNLQDLHSVISHSIPMKIVSLTTWLFDDQAYSEFNCRP